MRTISTKNMMKSGHLPKSTGVLKNELTRDTYIKQKERHKVLNE